jgi:group I intron endonuclease
MIGIYKITNPEGKIYIGYSKNIETRWASHKSNQHKANYKLKESLTKYGGDSHVFELIEEVDISSLSRGKGDALLRKRERYWIKKLDTFYNGLNSNGGGSGCKEHTKEAKRLIGEANSKPKPKDFGKNRKKWQHTEEWKEKLRNAPRCPILIFDMEDNFIIELPNQKKVADYIGSTNTTSIQLMLRKKPNVNGKIPTSIKGYKLKYKNFP